MPKFKSIILLVLLFACQNNNANTDEFIKIADYIQKANQHFDGKTFSLRIKEYWDIRVRFFLPDDINKENEFKILQIDANSHRYKEIGYGTYIIKDGIITSFKVKECKHKVADILTDQKLRLYYTDQDLEKDYYLLLEKSKIKLWGGFLRYPGIERKVDDIPVIIVDYNGFTKGNAQIRKYPSLDNDNIVKYIDDNNKILDYVPKDTFVVVYARTKNKYQVGKSYNYWYLVRGINFSEPAVDLVLTKYIWIFAEDVEYESPEGEEGPTGFPYD